MEQVADVMECHPGVKLVWFKESAKKKKKEIDKKFLEWLVLARDGRRKRCICVVFPAVTPQQETPQGKRVFFYQFAVFNL